MTGIFDLFHIGPDGLLYFTDLHNNIHHLDQKGSPEFCVESLHHEVDCQFHPYRQSADTGIHGLVCKLHTNRTSIFGGP